MRLLSVYVWLLYIVIEIMSFWPFKIVILTSNEYKKRHYIYLGTNIHVTLANCFAMTCIG
jgi:hypothetical protein